MKEKTLKEKTYFEEFVEQYNITDQNNTIEITLDNGEMRDRRLMKIFSEDKDGNLRILCYSLKREAFYIERKNPDDKEYRNRYEFFYITRYAVPLQIEDKKTGKISFLRYQIPKGAGTHPFFPPLLIDKWEKREKIKTLVLTEGYKKAFYASLFDCPVVGFSSITHYKDADTNAMYQDVITLIKDCHIENVIMLYDGDCTEIKSDDIIQKEDLYKRPNSFLSSIEKIRELFKDFNVDLYFANVNSEAFESKPKGLDDILLVAKNQEKNLIKELLSLSITSSFFTKIKINLNLNKVIQHLGLGRVENFYNRHQDRLGNDEFKYRGNTYRWDIDKKELVILIPAEAKDYLRVGDDYFKFVGIPNKYGEKERELHKRKRATIKEDHGDRIFKSIPKYEAFCNVPNNQNYQDVIHNCFNLFFPFEHKSEPGECPLSLSFIRHIFQEQYEMGLDYVQLLYTNPAQKLPILCLISKENNTGKSTFAQYLQLIHGQNAIIIGNEDLHSDFNSHWISKLVIGIDEGLIEKASVIEKLKKLSTDEKVVMQAKNKDQRSIDFFGKFIINSNNETTFIKANENDTRYWIRKVPVLQKDDPHIKKKLFDEIPAFLHFLENRKLSTLEVGRMWFDAKLLKTDALSKLVKSNKPQYEKMINEKVRELFLDTNLDELRLPISYIREQVIGIKTFDKDTYIRFILEESLGLERYKTKWGKYDPISAKIPYYDYYGNIEFKDFRCRPYIFTRQQFISPADEELYGSNSSKELLEPNQYQIEQTDLF